MTVDDQLRAVMRAHDAEAPTRVTWPAAAAAAPRFRRPTPRFALAVALVAVLVAGGTWLAVAWPRAARTSLPAGPLSCPPDRDPTVSGYDVPAPATVPGAADRLAPTVTPDSVVVCGYIVPGVPGPRTAPVPLTGSVVLSGDLDAVSNALTGQPRIDEGTGVCDTSSIDTDDDDYLVGLSYPDGTMWVVVKGDHCAGASNGSFVTSTNLLTVAQAWLATGRAGTGPGYPSVLAQTLTPIPGCEAAPGRPGQDTAMVPASPISLRICAIANDAVTQPVTAGMGPATDVAAALNAVPAAAPVPRGEGGCQLRPGHVGPSYTLVFSYADGPAVQVNVQPECGAQAIQNGSLEASDTSTLLPVLAALVN